MLDRAQSFSLVSERCHASIKPSLNRLRRDTDTNIPLKQLCIYDGDELVFDGSDPNTYTVCETAEQFEAAFAAAGAARTTTRNANRGRAWR